MRSWSPENRNNSQRFSRTNPPGPTCRSSSCPVRAPIPRIAVWAMDRLGNVTVLEQPVRITTLVSALQTAVRARQRQYQLRDQMEAQALLASVVHSSDDAIVSKTLDGIITSWNAGAERLFGYSPEEAIGQSITLIIPPDRREEEHGILEQIRNGKRLQHMETVRVSKSGERLDISVTISPIRDPNGRIVGASKVARDISARKRATDLLRQVRRAFASCRRPFLRSSGLRLQTERLRTPTSAGSSSAASQTCSRQPPCPS